MNRKSGSKSNGYSFNQETVDLVWRKGSIVLSEDHAKKRKDICGAWIEYNQYGVTNESGTGWEIDHIVPVALGGKDSISNLQPLQWQNNRHKGDEYPNWRCFVSSK